MYSSSKQAILAAAIATCITLPVTAMAGSDASIAPQGVVATVEGYDITTAEYASYYAAFARQRFYHRRAPADEVEALKTEVLERLILYRLLLIEADRRQIKVDETAIDKQIAALRGRFERGAALESFEARVGDLRRELLGNARVLELEKSIRRTPSASKAELHAFYTNNRDLFTEPARDRIRAILIGVQPWDPAAVWKAAELKAAEVVEKLKAGQEFGALAKQYSTHESAKAGGDMGYLHQGMLDKQAEETVAGLAPGEYTGPIRALEGYVVIQLVARELARVQSFEEAGDRVAALYDREASERSWWQFTSQLRQQAAVKVSENVPLDIGAGPQGN